VDQPTQVARFITNGTQQVYSIDGQLVFDQSNQIVVVLNNQELVRKLISLGWDTLEVHDNSGYNGIKYKLYDYSGIGGVLGFNQ
jgi:hypothetical protein